MFGKVPASRGRPGALIEGDPLREDPRPEDLDYSLPTVVCGFSADEDGEPTGCPAPLSRRA